MCVHCSVFPSIRKYAGKRDRITTIVTILTTCATTTTTTTTMGTIATTITRAPIVRLLTIVVLATTEIHQVQ